ncbi:MAG TPA: (2Fe-2S)-binding protein [Bacillus bacterium]|uniref:2Fe-2S ferredoxin-type domain-containing protein n=1 Tax=Siminovitchia fordii TaxID=254759 RepID=A0ABQ4K7C3_9BACI|nr:(2Fe-2S)-binding protein [Siminovitchia fordii]GIN20930.1 hypothetical protein J1TS3_20640 [Siminovitchia fordii]HBZ12096.1 (2Fe-2S)-binding protein [Bacillus sp. (in: firmicutes)]
METSKNCESRVTFYFDGNLMKARRGQTIAGALMANGIRKLGLSRKLQQARGVFCASGRCYSCFVSVNGLDHVLSCMTLVEEGANVYSNNGDPDLRRLVNGN